MNNSKKKTIVLLSTAIPLLLVCAERRVWKGIGIEVVYWGFWKDLLTVCVLLLNR